MNNQIAKPGLDQSYTSEFRVSALPEAVYTAITEEIDRWWTTASNRAQKIGDTLTVEFGNSSRKVMTVTQAVPGELIVWNVTEAVINIKGVSKKDEWVGTNIHWRIEESGQGSKISFMHEGLVPTFDCYDVCEEAWTYFLGSLREYLNGGQGKPHKDQ